MAHRSWLITVGMLLIHLLLLGLPLPRYFFLWRRHKAITNCERIPPAMSIPKSTGEAVRVGTKDWWSSSIEAQSTTTITAKKDHRQFQPAVEPPPKAWNSKRPKIKYSMTCAAFLINACIKPISWCDILGTKKRRTVSIHENVFSEENVSVDIQKIKHIQKITGSQYLMKFRLEVILTFHTH